MRKKKARGVSVNEHRYEAGEQGTAGGSCDLLVIGARPMQRK